MGEAKKKKEKDSAGTEWVNDIPDYFAEIFVAVFSQVTFLKFLSVYDGTPRIIPGDWHLSKGQRASYHRTGSTLP